MISSSRRGFLRGLAGVSILGAGGCLGVSPRKPGQKIRLAAVGIWGKGFSDWMPMMKSGLCELVALCDVDRRYLNSIAANEGFRQLGIDLAELCDHLLKEPLDGVEQTLVLDLDLHEFLV